MYRLVGGLLVVLWLVGSVEAAPFGPETYVVPTGKPQTVVRTFAAGEGVDAILSLQAAEGKRVSTGSVVLNGVQLLAPADFNQQVSLLQREVKLARENRLEFSFGGPPGAAVVLTLAAVAPEGLSIRFDVQGGLPADGASVSVDEVTVGGAVTGATPGEVGVTVNGQPALVQNGRFVANQVPLAPGVNTLRAIVTDAQEGRAEAAIQITQVDGDGSAEVEARPAVGLGPLAVEFETSVYAGGNPIVSRGVTCSGPQTVVATALGEGRFSGQLSVPGLYLCSVEATDSLGQTWRGSTGINVHDPAALDTLLQGKWHGMQAALTAGDVESALQYVISERSEDYRALFTKLSGQFAAIFAQPESFILKSADEYEVVYENIVIEEDKAFSYHVRFIPDRDGRLRLTQF